MKNMFTRSRGGVPNYGTGRGGGNNFQGSGNQYNQQGNLQQNTPSKPQGQGVQQQQQQKAAQPAQNTPIKPPTNQTQKPVQQQNQQQQPNQPQQPVQQPQQQQKPAQVQNQQPKPTTQAQKPAAAQNQQQKPAPTQNPPAVQAAGTPARLKPILKQSAPAANPNAATVTIQAAVAATNNTNTAASEPTPETPVDEEVIQDEDIEMSGDTEGQSRWKRFKGSGNKVNKKLKRLRMNQRLRKTLMPKNAIMVLNEMKAGVKFTLIDNQSVSNSMFLVHAELDGKVYVGQGLSKPLARQSAAENALKGLLLEKMNAASKKMKMDEDMDISIQNSTMTSEDGSETGNNTDTPMETNSEQDEPDDIPWSSLASFALYKLFLEWQNQGTVVPMPRAGVQQPTKQKADNKSPAEKKLPPNPWTIHPVMLLNQMKPGSTYVEVNRRGNPPNTIFTLSVDIDGEAYSGEAKNKKDAKKMAAKNALKVLFNLEYPSDQSFEDPTTNNQSQVQVAPLA